MIDLLKKALSGLDAQQIVSYIVQNYAGRTVFSTSFGIEDQVITEMLSKEPQQVSIFTLETGRLFPETYYVWNRTLERYNLPIKAFYPQTDAVEAMVSDKGPSSFYESVANRKECCFIRKIEPLKRAIKGFDIWITGIRAEQSPNREEMDFLEWDEANSIVKVHPLFYWSLDDVEAFLKQFNVPYNPLHDRGFPSIGCQPCTRAVKKGEDFRAGRWWWEDKSKKECGLHGGS
ncbi:phosphoadenosine phosphosulfate reductase [Sphingobacterium nematocida]|uniref:Adenosine 5'-phosphosulfate reductase n=1 Tax=Sphingobacterium nematocida TaxID=1513896 RepID=A0A1T5CJC2_9SPHI|nr:phosphoadenylyl-sulfate reductase [Sphingobacterium nematocida]SKB59453.1 phosphoadenosine phosphosulfate reductase [Sphingobacterium nematocida]